MEQQQQQFNHSPLHMSFNPNSSSNNNSNSNNTNQPTSPSPSPAQTRHNWSLEDWHLRNNNRAAVAPISVNPAGYAHLQEAMWQQMTLHEESDQTGGLFPERPGEPDCDFYMRTGQCGFGPSCRFNHPPNRKLQPAALGRDKGEYPERVGQPECQYYMKTGTCKFGSTCKFHHPRDVEGRVGRVPMNSLGYPIRAGEKDCAFYMRTGGCKFGQTCKFNHPQLLSTVVTMPGSSIYPSNGSPATPSPQPFPTGVTSWSLAGGPYMSRSRFQSPSNFAPLILQPQNMISVPSWNPYQARMGTVPSGDVQQSTLGGTNMMYAGAASNETPSSGITYIPGSAVTGIPSTVQSVGSKEPTFPERPGQPDCQYYMKTGDCKYGTSCRFNHPKERSISPNCILSPLGLPLRQGAPQCAFYMQYSMCKFGHTCKFDHPISSITYSPSASSLTDMPVTPYPVGLSVPTVMSWSSDMGIPGSKAGKVVTNNMEKQQEYEETYIGSNGGDLAVPGNASTGSAGSSRSSSADSIDLRGDSNQTTLNASS